MQAQGEAERAWSWGWVLECCSSTFILPGVNLRLPTCAPRACKQLTRWLWVVSSCRGGLRRPKSDVCHAFLVLQVNADGTTLEADNGEVIPDVDVIIFATGFDIAAPLAQFDIRARGAELGATLEVKPEGYYGMAVAGFPNLFTLLGLNTGALQLHVGLCGVSSRRFTAEHNWR